MTGKGIVMAGGILVLGTTGFFLGRHLLKSKKNSGEGSKGSGEDKSGYTSGKKYSGGGGGSQSKSVTGYDSSTGLGLPVNEIQAHSVLLNPNATQLQINKANDILAGIDNQQAYGINP